jgi:Secretion system C-terminal sorting domain
VLKKYKFKVDSMNSQIFFCAFLFFVVSLTAQPSIQWQKSLGGSNFDEAYAIQETSDGGFITAGLTVSNNGDISGNHGLTDLLVVKYSKLGMVEWLKTYGGSGNERAYGIETSLDGGYIVVGLTEGSNNGDVSGNHGGKDVWVIKLSNTGAIQWQKCFGGSGWDEAWAIKATTDGGYVIAGRSNSIDGDVSGNHGFLDYWVLKMSNAGVIEWQKCFGGTNEDNAYAIRQTSDGGFIVAGESLSNNGDVSGNHGDMDYWIIKLDQTGKLEWQKCYGGNALDRANDVLETEDGGYVVIGQASSDNGDITHPRGGYDIWVVKMSHNGTLEWQKSIGGSDQDWGRAIQRTSDGGYVICGTNWSNDGDIGDTTSIFDIWIIKLTANAEVQWQKTIGGSLAEDGNAIRQTSDGGFIVGGSSWSNDGDLTAHQGKTDFWVVKLSPASVGLAPEPTHLPLEISPNPVTESITLRFGGDGATIQVSIMDAQGRRRLHARVSDGGQINVSGLPAGLYFVSAWSATGNLYSGKFLKGF